MAQTGDVVGGFVESNDAEVWGPPGYASRPARANKGKDAAQALTINQGSNDIIFAFRDIRASGLIGTLGPGETCVYAPGPSNQGTCKALFQNDGSATMITMTAQTLTISSDTTNINSGSVNLGNSASSAVALAPPLQTWATAVNVALTAIAALLNAPGAVIGAPGAVPVTPPLSSSVASSAVKAAS